MYLLTRPLGLVYTCLKRWDGSVSLFTFLIPGFDYRYQLSAVPVWIIIAANALVFWDMYSFSWFLRKTLCFDDHTGGEKTTGYYNRSLRYCSPSDVYGVVNDTGVHSSGPWFLLGANILVPFHTNDYIQDQKGRRSAITGPARVHGLFY
jgi:hypothetical protein